MLNKREHQNEYIYPEEMAARKHKRNTKIKSVLIMMGCIALMVAVMYITAALCAWIDDQMHKDAQDAAVMLGIKDENGNDLDINGNIVDSEGNIIEPEDAPADGMYTGEQLNAKVLEAKQEARNELLDMLRIGVTEGDSVIWALRALFPDELIVSSGGKYHFVPIDKKLKLNDLRQENLNILESGEYQYVENGQITSYKGIDVSKHQGEIDWEKVAADGVQFAFIRVGYRGYGASGKLVEDEYFEANIKGAISAGIKVGVYFYSQAINTVEAAEEAAFVLERIAPYKVDCPIVFDVELVDGAEGRMDVITLEERTNVTLAFCKAVENAGYKPMVYYNMEMGTMLLDLETLEGYDKWFASYSDHLYYPYEYKVWQYTASGKVNGIRGNVDLNICFEPIWE